MRGYMPGELFIGRGVDRDSAVPLFKPSYCVLPAVPGNGPGGPFYEEGGERSPRFVVGERVRIDVDVVGFGSRLESDSGNRFSPLYPSFADAVHAVHDASFGAEDDGVGKVGFFDQLRVEGDVPSCGMRLVGLKPVGFFMVEYGLDFSFENGEVAGQFDEAVDVPEKEPLAGVTLVVLASHAFA